MRALGAYIFAGGFTVGVERAGFDITCHLEGSDYGVSTAKANWPELPVHYPEAKWPEVGPEVDDLDFVYCNPPCAVFSPMGIITTRGPDSWRDDPRTSCWHNAFGLLERKRPRAWACESVPQAYTRGRSMIDDMTRRALAMGYSVTHLLLDAKWTGIPQSRRRFFLVCHRPSRLTGYQFNYAPPPTVGEVLDGVAEPGIIPKRARPDFAAILGATKPGERLIFGWQRLNPPETWKKNKLGQVSGRPSFGDRRLNRDETMGAWIGDKFYHPTDLRVIGSEEAKALCGYPPDFQLKGPASGWGSLLARAVMPSVGEWLAKAVIATLQYPDGDWAKRTVTLVDVREPGIAPVDLTSSYLTKDGHVMPAALAEVIGPAASVTVIENEEMEEEDAGTAGDDAGGADAGHREGGAAVAAAGRLEAHTVVPAPAVAPRRREEESVPSAANVNRWDVIAELTGIDRDAVKRAGMALAFTRDAPLVSKITGVDQGEVDRIAAALALIAPARSPAGTPTATAARLPEEPVIAGTGASPAGTSGPVPDRLAPAGETSRERAARPSAALPTAGGPPSVELSQLAQATIIDPATLSPSEKPLDGEGSGAFIRRLLMRNEPGHTPERIVELVLAGFEGRKTTVKDVAWNYNKLLIDGSGPPPWRGAKALRPNSYPGMKGAVQAAVAAPAVAVAKKTPAAPAVNRGAAPRIVVTGFTRAQAKPREKVGAEKIDVPALVVAEMRRLGVAVDWSASPVGTERSDFDGALVYLSLSMSIPGCQFAAPSLWTLAQALDRKKRIVVGFDDAKVDEAAKQLEYLIKAWSGPARKRLVDYAKENADTLEANDGALLDAAKCLLAGSWPALIPAFAKWGDREVIARAFKATRYLEVDPTPVSIDLSFGPRTETPDRRWFLAALGDHSKWVKELGPTWPVAQVGHRAHGPKLETEADVLAATEQSWGVLGPPYNHGGSGWFRARYVYSALARRVLLTDAEDQKVLGEPYKLSVADVEIASDDELAAMAEAQRSWMMPRVATDRDVFSAQVKTLIEVLTS